MQDFGAKTNSGGGADSNTTTKFGGGESTCLMHENKFAVSRSGQTLDAAGTNTNLYQLSKAMFINAIGAQSFLESGAVNAYVVTPVTGTTGLVFPDHYDYLNGVIIAFIPGNIPTGASTLDIGQSAGTLLGTKKILNLSGGAIASGDFDTTNYHEFIYDPAADGATGAWIFIGKKGTTTSGLYNAYAQYSDVKATGTDGGTFTAGTTIDHWRTRDLTVEGIDDNNIGVLAANQITLLAGTYVCSVSAPAYAVSSHAIRLYDTTGVAVLLGGTSERAPLTGTTPTRSFVSGQFTIAVPSALEVQHYCTVTKTSDGFGYAANIPSKLEIYTVAEFWRVA